MASSQAPGRLEIAREFVNTMEFSGGPDDSFTAGSDELESWCRESGFCPDIDEQGLARLRRFREAVRAVLETHVGEGEEPALWEALQPFAEQACYGLGVSEGRPVLRPQGEGAERAIAELFAIMYDAIASGTWARLKACRKHTCRFAFYDRSKNGSGVWCSMQVCGNRVKAQKRRLSRKNPPEK